MTSKPAGRGRRHPRRTPTSRPCRSQDNDPSTCPASASSRPGTSGATCRARSDRMPRTSTTSPDRCRYVTGSHTFKAGGLLIRANAHTTRDVTGGGTVLQVLNGVRLVGPGVRDAVRPRREVRRAARHLRAGSVEGQAGDDVSRRAIRLYNASVPGQTIGQGPWYADAQPELRRSAERAELERLHAAARRLLRPFGNGKTALKAHVQQVCVRSRPGGVHAPGQPVGAIATNATRTWTDRNDDFIPQAGRARRAVGHDFGLPGHHHTLRPRRVKRLGQARLQLGSLGRDSARAAAASRCQRRLLPPVVGEPARVAEPGGLCGRLLAVLHHVADGCRACLTAAETSCADSTMCSPAKFGQTEQRRITFVDNFGAWRARSTTAST